MIASSNVCLGLAVTVVHPDVSAVTMTCFVNAIPGTCGLKNTSKQAKSRPGGEIIFAKAAPVGARPLPSRPAPAALRAASWGACGARSCALRALSAASGGVFLCVGIAKNLPNYPIIVLAELYYV